MHVVDECPELFLWLLLPVPAPANHLHHPLDPFLVHESHQLPQVVRVLLQVVQNVHRADAFCQVLAED